MKVTYVRSQLTSQPDSVKEVSARLPAEQGGTAVAGVND